MDDEIDLRQYVLVLWRRRYLVIIVIVAAVAAGLLVNVLSPSLYESVALIQLSEDSASMYATPASAARVITNPDFLDAVAVDFGLGESGSTLQGLIKIDPLRDTRMIRLRARYGTVGEAQRLASTVSNVLISRASERVREKREATERRLETVSAQMADVQRILGVALETLSRLQRGTALSEADRGLGRAITLNSIGTFESLHKGLLDTQGALISDLLKLELPTLVQKPSRPSAPIAPRKTLNLTLAAILGVTAATMLAFVAEYFAAGRSPATAHSPATPSIPRRSDVASR